MSSDTEHANDSGFDGMERFTLRIPPKMLKRVESLVESGHYPNRSEAVRAAIGDLLDDHDLQERGSQ